MSQTHTRLHTSPRRGRTGPDPGTITIVGLLITAAFVGTVLVMLQVNTAEGISAMVLTPVLFVITLPALARHARREDCPRLLWILVLALALKLCGAVARNFVEVDLYEGVADASAYHRYGVEISAKFLAGNFDSGLDTLVGTNFIRFFTGVLYTVIGPSKAGGFLFYSWLGFIGLFYFYRAFTQAMPEGRRGWYATLLLFLPSNLFWPSAIGKEAWMMFAVGIAAFGIARIFSGETFRGSLTTLLGMWLGLFVRPHIVGMIGLALLFGYLFRKPREDLRELAPVAKTVTLVVVAIVALVLLARTEASSRKLAWTRRVV